MVVRDGCQVAHPFWSHGVTFGAGRDKVFEEEVNDKLMEMQCSN